MNQKLDVLGGITSEQFLTEYWQKKPLLVRQAMPEIIDLLTPDDIKELALEDTVSARLIKQKDKDPDQWSVKNAPLQHGDFQKLPKLWTLLVQAVDHYSIDIAHLWKKFPFIPQWRRDDVMVSYAPQGGSVGKHFDFYDVFLVQGYGHRRWQLGQTCDETTVFVPNQPLKLLPDMQVVFDEVLQPGDLLYVPPGLSHYGVAQDDCLTFSFGFRMPNIATMMDRVSDKFADNQILKNPLQDIARVQQNSIGQITHEELQFLKAKMIDQLQKSTDVDDAIMSLMSEPKYPDNLPEPDPIDIDELAEVIHEGYLLGLEPASRVLYTETADHLKFWANGESLEVPEFMGDLLKKLADGDTIQLNDQLTEQQLDYITDYVNDALIMLIPQE